MTTFLYEESLFPVVLCQTGVRKQESPFSSPPGSIQEVVISPLVFTPRTTGWATGETVHPCHRGGSRPDTGLLCGRLLIRVSPVRV